MLRHAVITNCTTRKAPGPAIALGEVPHAESVLRTAQRWMALVRRTPGSCSAGQLYKGRSISDATAVAQALGGRLYVVSAGLGLVATGDTVPNYDLTVVPGSALADSLAMRDLGPEDWWNAITKNRPSPLSTLISRSVAYVALPATYMRLVRDDLSRISDSSLDRLRIFTSEAGRAELPDRFASGVMPYDERLEALPGFNGTRADFPQRALRHFVEKLEGHHLPLSDARRAVSRSLARLRRPQAPARARASDEDIQALLRRHWRAHGGSSTRLLRYLRDEAKVSCEQGRFRSLWRSLTREMEG